MKIQSITREDTYRDKGHRKALVDLLIKKGIKDKSVLNAIEQVPRHFFLDEALHQYAYEDRAFEILAGQTISQPYTVAFQTQFLNVQKYDKILEVGTGSAYQACVLASMGAHVYTIERQKILYEYNNDFFYLKRFPNIKRFFGDGFKGLPTYAPFDKIIITAAAPFIPEELISQMKIGGVMIAPVDVENGERQQMKKIIKTEQGIITEDLGYFNFVPMLDGKE